MSTVKALLMFTDRDFRVAREPQVGEVDLIQDLELNTVWDAMAGGDEAVRESACSAMLSGLTTPEQIRYRQAVLTDCLNQPVIVREIYGLATRAVTEKKRSWRGIGIGSRNGGALLHSSIAELEMFVGILKQLRTLTEHHADQFGSAGFTRFFDTLRRELDDGYFDEIARHLRQLRFHDGVLASAQLGDASQGIAYVLRAPRRRHRGSVLLRRPAVKKPAFSHTIPRDDEAGGQALGALRDRVLILVANALAQSCDHVASFFAALRSELGFYVGCLNLHDRLAVKNEPVCLPDAQPPDHRVLSARSLYDPCLSLRMPARVHGNDLNADGKTLLMITGANEGGKSTFLRSIGIAQLMMQTGMFVAGESFSASIRRGVFTHYKREELAAMTSGKFDEELARMSEIVGAITTNCLLLCNESFAATNEREASEIAAGVVRAMIETGNTVIVVSHLFELAHRFYQEHADTTLFLRAARGDNGRRSFNIAEGEPLSTSYGEDLYRSTFGVPQAGTDSSVTATPPR